MHLLSHLQTAEQLYFNWSASLIALILKFKLLVFTWATFNPLKMTVDRLPLTLLSSPQCQMIACNNF